MYEVSKKLVKQKHNVDIDLEKIYRIGDRTNEVSLSIAVIINDSNKKSKSMHKFAFLQIKKICVFGKWIEENSWHEVKSISTTHAWLNNPTSNYMDYIKFQNMKAISGQL